MIRIVKRLECGGHCTGKPAEHSELEWCVQVVPNDLKLRAPGKLRLAQNPPQIFRVKAWHVSNKDRSLMSSQRDSIAVEFILHVQYWIKPVPPLCSLAPFQNITMQMVAVCVAMRVANAVEEEFEGVFTILY